MPPTYSVGQMTLFGQAEVVAFGDDSFRIEVVPRDIANRIIKANHYSGKVFGLSSEHHGVYIDGALVGILQWGPGMNPASGGGVVEGTPAGAWLELNRMWLDDVAPRNSESRAISYSVKLLKRTRPRVEWVQSFADERCGCLGVVYQACSFLYLGEHTSTFWELDGEMFHNIAMTVRGDELEKRKGAAKLQRNAARATRHDLRQFRYWRSLRGNPAKRLKFPVLAYPKRAPVDAAADGLG
jgi:adenine modification enzyme